MPPVPGQPRCPSAMLPRSKDSLLPRPRTSPARRPQTNSDEPIDESKWIRQCHAYSI